MPAKSIVPPLCGYDSHRGVERDNDRYFAYVLERLIRKQHSLSFVRKWMRREGTTFSPHRLYLQKEMTFLAPSLISFTHVEVRSLRRERLRCMCLIQGSEKLQEHCLFWW